MGQQPLVYDETWVSGGLSRGLPLRLPGDHCTGRTEGNWLLRSINGRLLSEGMIIAPCSGLLECQRASISLPSHGLPHQSLWFLISVITFDGPYSISLLSLLKALLFLLRPLPAPPVASALMSWHPAHHVVSGSHVQLSHACVFQNC